MNTTPIFIGGLMKSGTSLLRALISNHPNVFGGLETAWYADDFQQGWQDPDSVPAKKLQTYFDLAADQYMEVMNRASSPEEGLQALMNHCTQRAGKKRWVEKTPGNVWYLDRIRRAWPEAHFIHVIREPLDVYASWKKNEKYDLPTFLQHVHRVEDCLGNLLGESAAGYLEVDYRSLVTDPRNTMATIIEAIGEPWDDRVAENTKGREDFEKVRKATGKASPTLDSLSKPIFTGSLQQWKSILTEDEAAQIREDLAGYYAKVSHHLDGSSAKAGASR